jgi:hypothetical protein
MATTVLWISCEIKRSKLRNFKILYISNLFKLKKIKVNWSKELVHSLSTQINPKLLTVRYWAKESLNNSTRNPVRYKPTPVVVSWPTSGWPLAVSPTSYGPLTESRRLIICETDVFVGLAVDGERDVHVQSKAFGSFNLALPGQT